LSTAKPESYRTTFENASDGRRYATTKTDLG